MSKLTIEGGLPLHGHVTPGGAKNATLPILVASLLAEQPTVLHHVPDIEDVRILIEIMKALGAEVAWQGEELHVDARRLSRWEVPPELGARIRYSLLLLGALLARFGKASVPAPGGCSLGERKFDLHIKGLEAMGARIRYEDNLIVAEADRLRGAEIDLYFPTKSGTDNIMIAASRAEGTTVIRNACRYPETADLGHFLNALGGRIEGAGDEITTVHGVSRLGGATYGVMLDRIEAATFMVASAITRGAVTLPQRACIGLEVTMDSMREAGVVFTETGGNVRTEAPGPFKPIHVIAGPDPFINTDIVPLITVLANFADGASTFRDISFEDRWRYTAELAKMGATMSVEPADFTFPGGQPGQQAVVRGPRPLHGAEVASLDLRGGVAVVLAGLTATGRTVVTNIRQIDRGYQHIERKLKTLGARIERVD